MRFNKFLMKYTSFDSYFIKKGDNPQNTSFSGKARWWLCSTYDKCFEKCGNPHILVILEDGVGICLLIIEDHWVNDSLYTTV
jgi:hypothetical protein